MKHVPALIAHARVDNGGGGRVVNDDGDIAGRMEECEVGGIEEGGGLATAIAAEDTATLATVLESDVRRPSRDA